MLSTATASLVTTSVCLSLATLQSRQGLHLLPRQLLPPLPLHYQSLPDSLPSAQTNTLTSSFAFVDLLPKAQAQATCR